MQTPRQNYIEIESHYEFDGTLVRMQQCLFCGAMELLEEEHSGGRMSYPIVNHVIREHLR